VIPKLRAVLVLLGLVALAVALLRLSFVVVDIDHGTHRRDVVVIGSKADTEGLLLGEIMAQWLEAHGGVQVERRFQLGGTNVCFEALRSGAIDLYPEYTGTGLVAILHEAPRSDRVEVYRHVRDRFAGSYALVLLDPFGFDNTYALAVPGSLAQRNGLHTISDLRGHPELRAGFAPEFLARADGWPGLAARYDLAFDEPPRSMEAGLMYRAAASGQLDVISAYSTDGRLDTLHLTVLDDDRHFFPPYEAAPLARRELLARHPAVRTALEALAHTLDDANMRRMNALIDEGHRPVREVARAFLSTLHAPLPPARAPH
jgi:glycine betaine/choline ABC-type transport system substrate-binding protein